MMFSAFVSHIHLSRLTQQ